MFIGLISVGREKCEKDKIGVRTREALCAGAGGFATRCGLRVRRKRRRVGVAAYRAHRPTSSEDL